MEKLPQSIRYVKNGAAANGGLRPKLVGRFILAGGSFRVPSYNKPICLASKLASRIVIRNRVSPLRSLTQSNWYSKIQASIYG